MKKSKTIIERHARTFTLLYAVTVLISSCVGPTAPIDDYTQDETEELIVDQDVEEVAISTLAPAEIINIEQEKPKEKPVEEFRMELKPIAICEKYFLLNGKLNGIIGPSYGPVSVTDLDEKEITVEYFFSVDGVLYLQTSAMIQGDAIPETDPVQCESVKKEYYFKQTAGVIEEIEALPEKPAQQRKTMIEGKWSIQDANYQGSLITAVKQEIDSDHKPVKNFLTVDSFYLGASGLWFSVPDGVKGAESGLWFIGTGSGRFSIACDYARIW